LRLIGKQRREEIVQVLIARLIVPRRVEQQPASFFR